MLVKFRYSSIAIIMSKPNGVRIMVLIVTMLMVLFQSNYYPSLMMLMDENYYNNAAHTQHTMMMTTTTIFPTTTTTTIISKKSITDTTTTLLRPTFVVPSASPTAAHDASNSSSTATMSKGEGDDTKDFLRRHPSSTSTTTTTVVDVNDGDTTSFNTTTNNIAVALIAFGNATQTMLVERTVRSIQSRGEWNSPNIPIVIITDKRGHYESIFFAAEQQQQRRQQQQQHHEDHVGQNPIVVLYPNREDWEDLPNESFKEIKLKYKRIKTRLIDYLDLDDRLSHIKHVLYLDIDIVVCKPITPFLNRYIQKYKSQIIADDDDTTTTTTTTTLAITTNDNDIDAHNNNKNKNKNNLSTSSSYSWMMAFEGDVGQGKAVHSGIMLLDRYQSNGCLQEWRDLIDKGRHKKTRNQELLRIMRRRSSSSLHNNKNNKQSAATTKTKDYCNFLLWKRNTGDMIFPKPHNFVNRSYPVFLHITNTYHVHLTNMTIQQSFLEDALLLNENERQSNMSLAKMTTTTTKSSSINITF